MPPLKSAEHHSSDLQHKFSSKLITSITNYNGQIPGNIEVNLHGGVVTAYEKHPFISAQYPLKILLNLNILRQESRFCDVNIIAGGTTFSAHRAVLSASSAYFEAMFRPELGLSEGTQKSVTLHSISPDIFKMLLEFIYTGRIAINQVNIIYFFFKTDEIIMTYSF